MEKGESVVSDHTALVLTALQLRGVGVVAAKKFSEALLRQPDLSLEDAVSLKFFPSGPSATELQLARDKAARVAATCSDQGISILSFGDADYPRRLAEIKDAPPLIYVRGKASCLNMAALAVVGTRNASSVGVCIAKRIATVLTDLNVATVSGLALGIDAAAHEGALTAGGITVAILAHGLDQIAPVTNRPIAERILSSGGALVSEHPPGVPPRPAEFVRRNRIQSGMSLGSVIVESGEIGGAMHQARFTKEQGRMVFAALPLLKNEAKDRFNANGGELLARTMGAIRLKTTEDLSTFLLPLIANNSRSGQLRFEL